VGDGAGGLGDVLSDGREPAVVSLAAAQRRTVRRSLERLEGRDRAVMQLRFGLDGRGERTLGAVGEVVGLSPERVRQLESAALEKLAGDPELAAWVSAA
jgi:RNA polymerase primary sigma factor